LIQHLDTSRSTPVLALTTSNTLAAHLSDQKFHTFSLASSNKVESQLAGHAAAPIHVMALRSRALLYLLEYGFDVLYVSLDTVDGSNLETRAGWLATLQQQCQATGSDPYSAPASLNRNASLCHSYDMVSIHSQQSAQGAAFSSPTNTDAVLLRHTPSTLHAWRRITQQHAALVARASIEDQVNVRDIGEQWYLRYELETNPKLSHRAVVVA
jgi:hypothetical protein